MKPVYGEVLKTFNMPLSAYSLYSASKSISAEPSLTHCGTTDYSEAVKHPSCFAWLTAVCCLPLHRQSYQAWVLVGIRHCYPECNEKRDSQHFAIDLPLESYKTIWNFLKAFSNNLVTEMNFRMDFRHSSESGCTVTNCCCAPLWSSPTTGKIVLKDCKWIVGNYESLMIGNIRLFQLLLYSVSYYSVIRLDLNPICLRSHSKVSQRNENAIKIYNIRLNEYV